jgi:hypothetical protein
VAPVALLTLPRLFAEAHFAAQDAQLTAWWLMLWAVQSSVASGARNGAAVGALLGLMMATKFTGWLAWAPTLASQAVAKPRPALRQLLLIVPVAVLTFYALNPPLWHSPVWGLVEHFHRNIHRGRSYSIAILFFGRTYDAYNSLPWYNTVAWLLLVTPVPILVLGLIGVWHCLVTRTTSSVALLLHWITLMIARALPHAPPHDGIRLFLPAFGFWCVFAGIGAQRAWHSMSPGAAWPWKMALRSAIVAALLAGAVNVARYYPQTLSHYNLFAGGVRGAADLGMEPTYWWDAMDNDVLSWLNEHTSPGEAIAFFHGANMTYLHGWGKLRPRDVDPEKDTFKWYVFQNRPGMFTKLQRNLISHETPIFSKYAGRRGAGEKVPGDLDVPLIFVFSYDQYQRALR